MFVMFFPMEIRDGGGHHPTTPIHVAELSPEIQVVFWMALDGGDQRFDARAGRYVWPE